MTKEEDKKKSLNELVKELPVKEVKREITPCVKDGVEGFEQTLVQFFPRENMVNIVKHWKEEAKQKSDWLTGYDKHHADTISELNKKKKIEKKQIETQLAQFKTKLTQEVKTAKESVSMWEKAMRQ